MPEASATERKATATEEKRPKELDTVKTTDRGVFLQPKNEQKKMIDTRTELLIFCFDQGGQKQLYFDLRDQVKRICFNRHD